jgi:hypothetical protein
MKYSGTDEIFEEIRRVVPIYRSVAVDDPSADGIWDAGLFPLAKVAPEWTATTAAVQPTLTLALDCLEGRFATRFERLFADAAARRGTVLLPTLSAS